MPPRPSRRAAFSRGRVSRKPPRPSGKKGPRPAERDAGQQRRSWRLSRHAKLETEAILVPLPDHVTCRDRTRARAQRGGRRPFLSRTQNVGAHTRRGEIRHQVMDLPFGARARRASPRAVRGGGEGKGRGRRRRGGPWLGRAQPTHRGGVPVSPGRHGHTAGTGSTQKRQPCSSPGTVQPPGTASQGRCAAIQRSSPPTAIEGGQGGAGPRPPSQQQPHPAQQGQQDQPHQEMLAPEGGPGQDRDKEKGSGIAEAHLLPRRFRKARTARASGPPAVHAANSARTRTACCSTRSRSARAWSRSPSTRPTRSRSSATSTTRCSDRCRSSWAAVAGASGGGRSSTQKNGGLDHASTPHRTPASLVRRAPRPCRVDRQPGRRREGFRLPAQEARAARPPLAAGTGGDQLGAAGGRPAR